MNYVVVICSLLKSAPDNEKVIDIATFNNLHLNECNMHYMSFW